MIVERKEHRDEKMYLHNSRYISNDYSGGGVALLIMKSGKVSKLVFYRKMIKIEEKK